jgi:hypothetical protein
MRTEQQTILSTITRSWLDLEVQNRHQVCSIQHASCVAAPQERQMASLEADLAAKAEELSTLQAAKKETEERLRLQVSQC